MGYTCSQPSSALKDEVTNKNALNLINSPSRSKVHSKSIIHLFKWYIKTKLLKYQANTSPRVQDGKTNSYEISKISKIKDIKINNQYGKDHVGRNNNRENEEQELSLSASSLAYRGDQRTESLRKNIRTSSTSARSQCTLATTASIKATGFTNTTSSSNLSCSHYIVRQSICLYAASSVILALCYLTTPTSASTEAASHPV